MNMKILGSFFLVVVAVVFGNQFFIKSLKSNPSREVANIFDRNSASQITWEQNRALEISKENLIAIHENPNWQDKLAFEYLAGKYDFVKKDDMISEIILKENVLGQRFDTQQFLDEYARKIVDFRSFKITHIDANHEVADLFSGQGVRVGSFTIKRDSDNRVTTIKVE